MEDTVTLTASQVEDRIEDLVKGFGTTHFCHFPKPYVMDLLCVLCFHTYSIKFFFPETLICIEMCRTA